LTGGNLSILRAHPAVRQKAATKQLKKDGLGNSQKKTQARDKEGKSGRKTWYKKVPNHAKGSWIPGIEKSEPGRKLKGQGEEGDVTLCWPTCQRNSHNVDREKAGGGCWDQRGDDPKEGGNNPPERQAPLGEADGAHSTRQTRGGKRSDAKDASPQQRRGSQPLIPRSTGAGATGPDRTNRTRTALGQPFPKAKACERKFITLSGAQRRSQGGRGRAEEKAGGVIDG